MINDNRISLEMSMHALDREISQLTSLVYEIDEVDRIYLKELYARLNRLVEKVDFNAEIKRSIFSRGAA